MSILCFGEPLMRLATLNHERLDSALNLSISYCGAETVVAVTLAQQGESAVFATKLASNHLGTNALMTLTRYGVDTSRVIRSNDRMGIYLTPCTPTSTGTTCSTASRSCSSRAWRRPSPRSSTPPARRASPPARGAASVR